MKDLVDGDEFHVYVVHEIDKLEELPGPIGILPWSGPIDESVGINTEGTVENDSYLNEVDTELSGGDTNQNEAESDLPSSDTDVDAIPNEDDSDVDEELRSLRAERRNKINPNLKKLGGDEKCINSSECESDDSANMLDAEVVGGVDLPGRRKIKKVRVCKQMLVNCYQMLKLECVLDTSGLIGVKDGRERKEENNSGDVPRQLLNWICDIAPMARLMLEENKKKSRTCKEPEPLVEHWYRKDTFLKAYSHFIQLISNMKMWPETNNPMIEPPKPKQMPGRPPRNRRKSKDEPRKKLVSILYNQVASQGSSHLEPTSSYQLEPTRFNQPVSTTSNSHASSTTVCGDTSRVAKTSQPPPFVDTSIPVTRGITNQLPPRTR
ncbi:hypothetical protein RDI58_008736 [Solanum bulbocastanum]|uniref:Uncharacterized protein n=1 Tax=Solanum bulbocastanum TaxID=147425 RepID=A0AAN8YNF5_SOLBU